MTEATGLKDYFRKHFKSSDKMAWSGKGFEISWLLIKLNQKYNFGQIHNYTFHPTNIFPILFILGSEMIDNLNIKT